MRQYQQIDKLCPAKTRISLGSLTSLCLALDGYSYRSPGVVSLDPRGLFRRTCVGDDLALLYTKYKGWASWFQKTYEFKKIFPLYIKSTGAIDPQRVGSLGRQGASLTGFV